jgi:hypothetical protein
MDRQNTRAPAEWYNTILKETLDPVTGNPRSACVSQVSTSHTPRLLCRMPLYLLLVQTVLNSPRRM